MRSGIAGVAIWLALTSLGHSASAATRSVALDLQRSERLIAVALRAGDVGEMKRQARDLFKLLPHIPATEGDVAKVFCTSAIQNLRNLADDLSYPGQAAKILAAENSQRVYLQYMKRCESEAGLAAPASPNLRER